MRVAHVIPGLATRTGGPAESVVQSALAVRHHGVEATVFTTDLAGPASAPGDGPVSADELPAGTAELDVRLCPVRPPARLAFSPGLFRALGSRLSDYDVVHIHSLFLFPQLAAYLQARRASVPYVVSPCGALDPYLRSRNRLLKGAVDTLWQRRMLEGAKALHYKTEEEARLVADLRLSPPPVIVPNGIRWSDFAMLPPRRELGSRLGDGDAPVVLTLGRLSHKKGLDRLIEAFALVRRTVPGCRLVIAGPDDEGLTPGLAALARRAGVGDAIVFTGMLHGREKLAALAAADVWALPSHTENFGLAVVEALAAGRPTVISPAVNVAPDVAAAGAGVVAPPEPEAFAAEIASLLHDDARRTELGARAREFARRYDWNAVAPRWVAMYAEAAGQG